MATNDQVKSFMQEMTDLNADWQLHRYGNTVHAFTNPQANDPEFGTVYNETAD
ncbi:MAG: dienelactone hydrolase family protein, partial [Thiotrichaceae bacterium]|nr:dienelactone hydrolase family protein [Thiotrichaceae bacterium]